jgi:hypothetical protein
MKKLVLFAMVATVLTIFNGCQKDEQVLIDEQPQAVVKHDVYVENGYLAFKNMEAVDSVIQMLGKMTTTEKETWESQIGLKSARSEFDKHFEEYEKLISKSEFLRFKSNYSETLKFNEIDEDDCSIDYPFATLHFLPVLNNKGVVKIGESLIKYTKEDHIVIKNGDINILDNLEDNMDNDNVFIYPKLKSSYNEDDLIHDFPEDNPFGSPNRWHEKTSTRRLLNELRIDRYRTSYKDANWNEYWVIGYYVNFKQRAQKKSWGSWIDYDTRYTFDELKKQIGNETIKEYNPYTPPVSPSVKPSANIVLHHFQSNPIYGIIPDLVDIPLISFSAKTSCQGFDGILYPIDHPVHSGFTNSSGGTWTPTPAY